MFQRTITGDTIREIVREAEAYLAAQLSVAVAADQRASTIAGILATLATALLGGGLAMLTGEKINYPLGLAGLVAGAVMMMGLGSAIYAARPVPFYFVGNSPKAWSSEDDLYGPLDRSLWEMAQHYETSIERNDAALRGNASHLRRAGVFTLISPVAGVVSGLSAAVAEKAGWVVWAAGG